MLFLRVQDVLGFKQLLLEKVEHYSAFSKVSLLARSLNSQDAVLNSKSRRNKPKNMPLLAAEPYVIKWVVRPPVSRRCYLKFSTVQNNGPSSSNSDSKQEAHSSLPKDAFPTTKERGREQGTEVQ